MLLVELKKKQEEEEDGMIWMTDVTQSKVSTHITVGYFISNENDWLFFFQHLANDEPSLFISLKQ